MRKQIIFVDFDGTIVEDNGTYPRFGDFIPYAKKILQELQNKHYLVLYSLRDDMTTCVSDKLQMAINFLKDNQITKFLLPRDVGYRGWKPPYDFLIDDRATLNGKIDWLEIAEKFKIKMG